MTQQNELDNFVKVDVNFAFWQSVLDKEENVNLAKQPSSEALLGQVLVHHGSPLALSLHLILGFNWALAAEEIVSLKQIKIVEKKLHTIFYKRYDIHKI